MTYVAEKLKEKLVSQVFIFYVVKMSTYNFLKSDTTTLYTISLFVNTILVWWSLTRCKTNISIDILDFVGKWNFTTFPIRSFSDHKLLIFVTMVGCRIWNIWLYLTDPSWICLVVPSERKVPILSISDRNYWLITWKFKEILKENNLSSWLIVFIGPTGTKIYDKRERRKFFLQQKMK